MGLTESEARDQGFNVSIAKMPMSYVARALEVDESRGFMKATVDATSGRILGCSVLGLEGGEIMSMVQIAMMGNLNYSHIARRHYSSPHALRISKQSLRCDCIKSEFGELQFVELNNYQPRSCSQ